MNRKQRRATRTPASRKASPALPRAFSVAILHAQAGRSTEALLAFRKAATLAPELSITHYNLGNALGEAGLPEEAASAFRKAIEITPGFPEAHSNLGAALKDQGLLTEAESCCRKAIELAPSLPIAHFNLGTVLEEQRQLEDAERSYRSAIRFKPDFFDAHLNLGAVLQARQQLKDAESCYREAVRLRPDFPEAHVDLALVLLAQGDMKEGWQEYEWRWRTQNMVPERRDFRTPFWSGEHGGGRTLLIYAEQGYGDTIQFCRYVPLAAARDLRIIMQVPKPLVRLLENLPGVDVVVANDDALPNFDIQIPLMSLPVIFETEIAEIPCVSPYLHANTKAVLSYATRLAAIDDQATRIGLVWAGNPRKHLPASATVDRRRSISLEQFAPLFRVPRKRFFSLQKDRRTAIEDFPLIDLMDKVEDFADTAALISNLDLIISVDTAVAHLAAALGKPVWLLNRFDSCWRWLAERRDSPWYPTIQLYRQPTAGDWDTVISEIARDLSTFPKVTFPQ